MRSLTAILGACARGEYYPQAKLGTLDLARELTVQKAHERLNAQASLMESIFASPLLRQARKQALAARASGAVRTLTVQRVPAASRQIWHIAPVLPESQVGGAAGELDYCLHPHTGQPLVVNGDCFVYDGDWRRFRVVRYRQGLGSHWAPQPRLTDGSVHMACEGGTLVATYRRGKCISTSFESRNSEPQGQSLQAN